MRRKKKKNKEGIDDTNPRMAHLLYTVTTPDFWVPILRFDKDLDLNTTQPNSHSLNTQLILLKLKKFHSYKLIIFVKGVEKKALQIHKIYQFWFIITSGVNFHILHCPQLVVFDFY